jgi:hypothetical protein
MFTAAQRRRADLGWQAGVVDDHRRVVGLVSALDVVRWVAHINARAVPPAAVTATR